MGITSLVKKVFVTGEVKRLNLMIYLFTKKIG